LILIPKYQLGFVHVPKTGGSSITAALAKFTRVPLPEKDEHGWQSRHHVGPMHATLEESRDRLPAGTFTFGFVRNPWDQALSLHTFLRNDPGESLRDFLKRSDWRVQMYLRPQGDWVDGCDFVGRFEALQYDFDQVCALQSMPPALLPHRNNFPRAYAAHDEETAQLVRDRWPSDCERLGYQAPA